MFIADDPKLVVSVLITVGRQSSIVIVRVKVRGHRELLKVINALGSVSFGLGLRERRQQQRRKNRDDRNYNQQFDKGESRGSAALKSRGLFNLSS